EEWARRTFLPVVQSGQTLILIQDRCRTGLAPGCLARGLGLARGCGYGRGMRISAVLIDIDGVLTVSWRPLPGAVTALRQLRAAGPAPGPVAHTTPRH